MRSFENRMCPNFTMCDRGQKESEEKKKLPRTARAPRERIRGEVNQISYIEHAVFNCLRKAATSPHAIIEPKTDFKGFRIGDLAHL